MKKVNPRRRPISQADIDRAKKWAFQEATQYCWAIMFSVIKDKYDGSVEDLRELWKAVDDLGDSVAKGYVTIPDLIDTLKTDYGIMLDTRITAAEAKAKMERRLKGSGCDLEYHGKGCYSVVEHHLPTKEELNETQH